MIIHNNMTRISSIQKESNEGMKVSNDDMKVAKFKVLCNWVNDCLNQGSNCDKGAKIYLFYGKEYEDNLFMSCVKEMCTRENSPNRVVISFGFNDSLNEGDDISKLIDIVKEWKKFKIIPHNVHLDTALKYRDDVIFWNLLAVTLDENVYEKNINKIIDLAYMFEFSEAMIKDWCCAVEFVLSGNFKGDFEQLNFDTAEANQYFKRVKNDTNKIVCSASGSSTQNDCLSQIRNLFGATEPLKRY